MLNREQAMPYNVRTWIFVETCQLNVSINKGKSSELCVTYVLVANLDLCTSSDKKKIPTVLGH